MMHRRARIALPVALIVLGMWLLVGCVYIPTFGTTVSGKNVAGSVGPKASRKPVRISLSTVTDVVRVLGEPPHATSDRRVFAYPWTVRNGIAVWPLCFAAYSVRGTRTLVLRFDEQHVLFSAELLSENDRVIRWDQSVGSPKLPIEIWEERAANARRIQSK